MRALHGAVDNYHRAGRIKFYRSHCLSLCSYFAAAVVLPSQPHIYCSSTRYHFLSQAKEDVIKQMKSFIT